MKPLGLTVVIPTAGRPTLQRCLDSLSGQDLDVLVVMDTHDLEHQPENYKSPTEVCELATIYGFNYAELDVGYHDWGYPQIDYGYTCVNTEFYLMNMGDDDVMIRGMGKKILEVLNSNPISPFMFQAVLHPSPHRGNTHPIILWNDHDRSIIRQRVTGQNLIVPKIHQLMGNMVDDFEFIRQTLDKWTTAIWVPVSIVECF